ncbi:helix-turn-helix domain-containing protein [Gemmatimonas sp.]|uniref:helix-turn-helix domain-containing protein n=1 Tax=Gemmatimonas sp. TaxID=1962908 RepID=UPI0039C88E5B
MRLRLPELLEERGLTPYAVAHHPLNGDRIKLTTMYRLVRSRGTHPPFSPDLLEALCEILEVEPGDLFERERVARSKAKGRR